MRLYQYSEKGNRNHLVMIILFWMMLSTISPFTFGQNRSDNRIKNIATFSIVACDSVTGELGVAVASRFFTVGSVVPWTRADIGAVATQSFANTSFGWRGWDLIK